MAVFIILQRKHFASVIKITLVVSTLFSFYWASISYITLKRVKCYLHQTVNLDNRSLGGGFEVSKENRLHIIILSVILVNSLTTFFFTQLFFCCCCWFLLLFIKEPSLPKEESRFQWVQSFSFAKVKGLWRWMVGDDYIHHVTILHTTELYIEKSLKW